MEASLNRREAGVTVGDVSAAAGVTVSQAETVLNALAYDTQGTLEVRPLFHELNKLDDPSLQAFVEIAIAT